MARECGDILSEVCSIAANAMHTGDSLSDVCSTVAIAIAYGRHY